MEFEDNRGAELYVAWKYTDKSETTCYIYKGSEIITAARAKCAKCDNFERRTGRKISFQRALDNLFSRPERTQVYDHLKTTGQMKILTKSWR